MTHSSSIVRRIAFIALAMLSGSVRAQAQNINLAWSPSSSSSVVGYTVRVGLSPGTYSSTFDVGAATTFSFTQPVPGTRYYFTVVAYDGSNNTSYPSNEVNSKINVGPALTALGNQTSAVGAATSLQIAATDDGDPLTFTAIGLPAGLSINQSTGLIAGTPTTSGMSNVGVTVSDGSLSATINFSWTINPRLTVTGLTSNVASPRIVGTSISFAAAATGGFAPYQYKFLVSSNGGSSWTLARTWSTSSSYAWTPSAAGSNYRVRVDARSNGVTADVAEGTAMVPYVVNAAPPPTADAVTPSTGSGSVQTFAFQYSDQRGATSLNTAWAWFNGTTNLTAVANSCLAYYDRSTNVVYLLSNSGSQWMSAPLGGSSTLQNSQCAISIPGSSVSLNGTTLTLNLAMTFASGFGGSKNIYMDAGSVGGLTAGWPSRGTWTVPGSGGTTTTPAVTASSVTPNSGSGATQTFAFQYSDSRGASNLVTTWAWFNSTSGLTSVNNSCLIYYNRPANTLYLLDNAGALWNTATPGASGTLQNSQCAISLPTTSVAVSGNLLTLNLAMTFASGFGGSKNIYMDAGSVGGLTAGWPLRGNWTVPGTGSGSPTVIAESVSPNTGSGSAQTFAFRYTDSRGATYLNTAWAWFNSTSSLTSVTSSCLIYYNRPTNTLYLLDNTGTQWITRTMSGTGTMQNSQCTISLPGSSATVNGTALTLNLAMTFASGFAGTKNVFMDAGSVGGLTGGWPSRGNWTVPAGGSTQVVGADSVTPNAGSGMSQTFSFQYSDTRGATNLNTAWVWFNSSTDMTAVRNTCLLYYNRPSHTLYLLSDSSSTWVSRWLGSTATLQNSQCSISAGSSTWSGNTLTLTLAVTFKTGFVGTKTIYMDAGSVGGLTAGWPSRGSWTVQ